jgi:hypothetical protein
VNIQPLRSALLLCLGLAGRALFFRLDSRNAAARLFPSRLFDWRTPLGTGMTMVAAFSIATCSFGVYGPLLLTTLHDVPLLTTGYIIAAESISWSILSILVAEWGQPSLWAAVWFEPFDARNEVFGQMERSARMLAHGRPQTPWLRS